MTLQDQCCTAEQGKRLQELGVKVEATFWHMPEKSHLHKEYIRYGWHSDAIAPAYTVAELGELLPARFITYSSDDRHDLQRGLYFLSSQRVGECPRAYGNTEAQARAAMLIYLLENQIIEPCATALTPITGQKTKN